MTSAIRLLLVAAGTRSFVAQARGAASESVRQSGRGSACESFRANLKGNVRGNDGNGAGRELQATSARAALRVCLEAEASFFTARSIALSRTGQKRILATVEVYNTVPVSHTLAY